MKTPRQTKTGSASDTTQIPKKPRRTKAKSASKANGKTPVVMYEYAPIGIVESSLDASHINVNEEFCHLLGYEREELIGKSLKDITHEDDYPIDIKLHQQLVEGKIPFYRLEKRYLHKNGDSIWTELTRSVVRDKSGRALHTIGVVLDISDRKHVERVLRDSTERLRLATEVAQMFTWELDLRTQIYTLADNFERVLGFSGGLLPKNEMETVQRLSPAEDVQIILSAFTEASERHGDLRALQYRMIDPASGQIVWVESSAKIVYDEMGFPERMFGVTQNITERRKAQEEIAIISRMPEENPNPVLRISSNGRVLYANNNGQSLLSSWRQDGDWSIPDELKMLIAEVFMEGVKREVEIVQDSKVFSATLAPVPEAGYVNLYCSDITERKQIERQQEALYRLTDRLHRINSLEDTFDAALDAILDALQCDRASILLFDEQDVMSFVAWRGLSDSYRKTTNGHSPWKPDAVNPVPICMDDVDTADLSESLRATIKQEGIRALAFIPLVSNGKLIGKFMTYYNTPHMFDEAETDLSLTIARQFAFGIDRRRSEEALRASEEKYRRIVETANEGIWEIDGDTNTTFVNARMAEMLGYRVDEILGRSSFEFTFPEDHLAGIDRLTLAKRGDPTQSREFRFRRRDGTALWTLVSSSPQLDEKGNFVGSIAMIVDITERRQIQQELARERGLLERLFETMPVLVSLYDAETKSVRLNGEFERLLGWRSEDVTVLSLLEALYPDPDYRTQVLQRMASAGRNDWIDVQVQTRDGRSLETLWSNISILEGDQLVTGIALGIDITERKQAEKRALLLAEVSELLRNSEDPSELLYRVSEAVGQHLQVKRCLFNEIDVENDVEIVHRDYANGALSVAGIHKVSDYSSITTVEIAAGRTVVNTDSKTDRRTAQDYERTYEPNGERAYVAVPMMRDHRWVASLWVSDDRPRQWSPEEISLLEAVAERTWTVIEKLRIGDELRAREAELESIITQTPFMLTRCTRDLRYRFVSRAYAQMMGRTAEELAGKLIVDVMGVEGFQTILPYVEKVLQGERVEYEDEVSFEGVGKPFLHIAYTPDWDDDGNVIGWFASIVDISERKHAENALQASEHRFREIFETAGVSVWLEDFTDVKRALDGLRVQGIEDFRSYFVSHPDFIQQAIDSVRILDVNNETLALFRATNKEDLLGSLGNVFAPETAHIFVEELMALAEGRETVRAETQVRSLDGRSISVLFTVHFAAPNDDQSHVVVTLTDITERKRAEEALRIENERFSRFVDSNIVGIIIADPSGKILLANDYYLGLLGVTRQDFLNGKVDWRQFTPAEWLQADEKAIRELRETGVCEPYEKEYVRADGTRVPVYIADAMLPGPGEEIAAFVLDLTQRKRAEESLRASEELYRTIARSIPGGGVYVVDKDMRYIVADGSVTTAFGLSREILEGHTVSEIFEGEQRERMIERLTRNFAGETISYETEYKGRVYWTQQAPLIESIGEAIIVTLDITERKQMEQALRQSEELFSQFMENLPGLAWIKDLNGRYVYANVAAEKVFGSSREILYGRSDREIFLPDIAVQFGQNDQLVLQEEKGIQVVETLPQGDGIMHYSLVTKFPIPGPDGEIALIGGTAFDITDRKQAEEALRESEERYHNLFDLVPIALYTCDANGLIQEYNQSAVELWGREPARQDPLEKYSGALKMYYPDGRSMPHEVGPMARMLRGETLALGEREILIERPDGTRRSILAHPFPIKNPRGELVEAINCLYDITERKQAEEALQSLNLQLETRVIMRTAELQEANAALQESRKRLQILSQRLVEVQEEERRAIARELHDRVGQTLSALNINMIIMRDQLSADSLERVGSRLNDSMHLVGETITLVRDVMSNLRPAVLDDYGLEAALQSHVDEYKSRYGIDVKLEKPAQPLPRLGSSIEMTFLRIAQEALMNIARHAKASRVDLSLWEDGNSVCMTIQDNGTGIVSWEQANRPGSHGLTIMRERAEAFGGSLQVASTPGKGTKIEMSIPIGKGDPNNAQKEVIE